MHPLASRAGPSLPTGRRRGPTLCLSPRAGVRSTCSPMAGTDFAPVRWKLCQGNRSAAQCRSPSSCRTTKHGCAMAPGYTMVTGQSPQARLVHVGMGTANSINGLINAARHEHPIAVYRPGATPPDRSPGAVPGARNNYITGRRSTRPGAMRANFISGTKELKTPSKSETAVDRALRLAHERNPQKGPVYLTRRASSSAAQVPVGVKPASGATPGFLRPRLGRRGLALEEARRACWARQATADHHRKRGAGRQMHRKPITHLARGSLAWRSCTYRPRYLRGFRTSTRWHAGLGSRHRPC